VSTGRYLIGDVFDVLATLPAGSMDLVVTSPPFLALRSYLPDGPPRQSQGDRLRGHPPADDLDTLLAIANTRSQSSQARAVRLAERIIRTLHYSVPGAAGLQPPASARGRYGPVWLLVGVYVLGPW
jgi:hypothetical protein